MIVWFFGGDLVHAEVIRSSSLSRLQSVGERVVLDHLWFLSVVSVALGGAESVALSGALQVMTLLPGVAFVLVMAFLATTVALNVGLVGCPFRFRLRSLLLSLLRTFLVGTRLAVSCIDLHLLQPVVVVVPVRNVSLGFSISSTIVSVTASLF